MGEPVSWNSLQPKSETLAENFIQETSFNGKDVVVAVLDTGVDPGADGLLVCPDGSPKVIDIIDCTGSGDVDTKTVVESKDNSLIKGLSGRMIKLNPTWTNPSGQWRIGLKRAYELFPDSLTNRIKTERKKQWNSSVHNAQVDLKLKLNSLDVEKNQKESKDVEERLEVLTSIDKSYDDPGPLYDIIVWFDGNDWCACVDSTETGDLTLTKSMRSYAVAQEYCTFSHKDNLNYTVTIFDQGNVCSICTDVGSHGTHVAGIVAAYHPEDQNRNGVAPGAKIISLKIGDSRMGSMETTIGLTRALTESVKHKVDIINMSYGEACAVSNEGRFVELASEVVNKHGIVFICAAGNNGPALSTVGAPGGTSSPIIGVAAMVSPAMMKDQYALSQGSKIKSPIDAAGADGVCFTWSSKGPCVDGSLGVSVTAPGAAISPVPTWSLQANALMNGTSMASPNAAGCMALVVSACKAEGWQVSPNLLRRALENSCKAMLNTPSLYAGRGLVQVPQTFQWVEKFKNISPDCYFDVTINNNAKGIYLRTKQETNVISTHQIFVKPMFHEDASSELKTSFDLKIIFETDLKNNNGGNCDWLKFPDRLSLNHGGRGFNVVVDPTLLAPGVHAVTLRGCRDCSTASPSYGTVSEGSLFEVQITVTKPLDVSHFPSLTSSSHLISLEPGSIQRSFLSPPRGATWCDVTLTDERPTNLDKQEDMDLGGSSVLNQGSSSLSAASSATVPERSGGRNETDEDSRMMVVHLLQLTPKERYSSHEKQQYLRLRPGQAKTVSISLLPQSVSPLEVCIAQFWSSPGQSQVQLSIKFRGVDVSPSELVVVGGGAPTMVKFHANLVQEEVEPKVTLDTWRRAVLPSSAKIMPLGERDILPNGKRCYELLLEYHYTNEAACTITPRAPILNELLYDSHLDAQLGMVFDTNKKFLGTSDTYPDGIELKLEGKHILRYSIRHDSLSKLEPLEKMQIFIDRKLKDELSLPIYSHKGLVSIGGTGGSEASILLPGRSRSMVVGGIMSSKLPKETIPGDLFLGTLTCVKKAQDLSRPQGWKVTYVIPSIDKEEKKTNPVSSTPAVLDKAAKQLKEMNEKVEKLKIDTLNSLSKSNNDDAWTSLYASMNEPLIPITTSAIEAQKQPSLKLLMAKLHHADRESTRKDNLGAVLSITDEVIGAIDLIQLSSKLNLRVDDDDDVATTEKKKLNEEKEILIDALYRKTRALLDFESNDTNTPIEKNTSSSGVNEFDLTFKQLQQWQNILDPKQAIQYNHVALGYFIREKKLGGLLKYVNSVLKEDKKKSLDLDLETNLRNVQSTTMSEIGWGWMAQYDASWSIINHPQSFTLH